jgi:hypothetical protein
VAFTNEEIMRATEIALRQYNVSVLSPTAVCGNGLLSGVIDLPVLSGVMVTTIFSGGVNI